MYIPPSITMQTAVTTIEFVPMSRDYPPSSNHDASLGERPYH